MRTEMNIAKIEENLMALRANCGTKTAHVRRIYVQIEQSVQEGVPLAEIVFALKAGGLDIALGTLKSALQRIRKERGDVRGVGAKKMRASHSFSGVPQEAPYVPQPVMGSPATEQGLIDTAPWNRFSPPPAFDQEDTRWLTNRLYPDLNTRSAVVRGDNPSPSQWR
jgi:hypothetical protein